MNRVAAARVDIASIQRRKRVKPASNICLPAAYEWSLYEWVTWPVDNNNVDNMPGPSPTVCPLRHEYLCWYLCGADLPSRPTGRRQVLPLVYNGRQTQNMSILFLLQFSQFYTHPREHALIIINFTVRDGMHVKFSPEQFVHSDLHTGSLPRLSYQLISPHSHTNPPGDAETLYRPQSALFTIRFYFTQYCSQKKSNKFTGRSCQ